MGEHLIGGLFVSDRYVVRSKRNGSNRTADKLVLSFHDPAARPALKLFANLTTDEDLAADVKARLRAVEAEGTDQGSGIKGGERD